MPFSAPLKKIVQDIAGGYQRLTPLLLQPCSIGELKSLQSALRLMVRDIRQLQIPADDLQLIKQRNLQLTRIHRAETALRSYCLKQRIKL